MGQWFYAFTLPPQTPSTPLPVRPANATPSPFGLVAQQLQTNGKKRTAEDDEEVFDESVTKKTKSGECLLPDYKAENQKNDRFLKDMSARYVKYQV